MTGVPDVYKEISIVLTNRGCGEKKKPQFKDKHTIPVQVELWKNARTETYRSAAKSVELQKLKKNPFHGASFAHQQLSVAKKMMK